MKHIISLSLTLAALVACGNQQTTAVKTDSNSEGKSEEIVRLVDEQSITQELVEQELDTAMTSLEMDDKPSQTQPTVSPAIHAVKTVKLTESMALAKKAPSDYDFVLPESISTENYADIKINSIQQVLLNPVSTFSTDVDTASYTNTRRFLSNGQLPPEDAIRVEEFVNYFDYQHDSPSSLKNPLAIQTEIAQTPWNEHTQLMRVSLQAYRSNFNDLPPLNLVFLLDVSGSMSSSNKLPLMQRSFDLLVNQLRPQDHVAIVVYAGASGVVLEPTAGDKKEDILTAINNLQSGGSTHGSAGIHLAYKMAEKHFDEDHINRIILGTDGDFNVGTTGVEDLKDLIEQKRTSGVFLNVLGFGTGNYNDYLMEELSNHGNGVAYYVDSYQEARKIFSEQLTSTLQTVAKDVKIQVEFNPKHIAEYRLLGYDNRQLNQEDFNNDKIDAGEMGSGHTVTALYEIVPTKGSFRFSDPLRYQETEAVSSNSKELAFVKVRYKLPNKKQSSLIDVPVESDQELSLSTAMQLATAAAGFAEKLRNSPYTEALNYSDLITLVNATLATDHWGYRQELLQLLKNAQTLSKS